MMNKREMPHSSPPNYVKSKFWNRFKIKILVSFEKSKEPTLVYSIVSSLALLVCEAHYSKKKAGERREI
ncbi:hypothetical protein [Enterococcus durans]|uniref:hypothetical protein n=2 Tax=Enterococcus TaxID=1350 RepID=UPI00289C81AC|nr:hypothetical protein [Enterococcus durans]